MKRIQNAEIVEKVKLLACSPGDHISIPYSACGSWKSIGSIILVKIKPLPSGKIQIKYRNRYQRNATVQKIDIPYDILVERKRSATAGDGYERIEVDPSKVTIIPA